MSEVRELFGGAILGSLPQNFSDVSNVRQVPDHQEVFVDETSETSIIIELLQQEDGFYGLEAIRHHFKDLAESNEALEVMILSEAELSGENVAMNIPADAKMALVGKQRVGKYRTRPDMEIDEVYIVLVLLRLEKVSTDLLISMNVSSKDFSSKTETEIATKITETEETADKEGPLHVRDLIAPVGQVQGEGCHKHMAALQGLLNSIEVRQWELFC